MTEDQARTKVCPVRMRLPSEVPAVGLYAGQLTPVQLNCLASDCMFWRWTKQGSNPSTTDGYCGEAGPP